jgi:hypothetical protein
MGTPVGRVGKRWRHSFLDFRDLAIPRGSRPSPAQEGSAESGPLAADPITYSGHMVRVNLAPSITDPIGSLHHHRSLSRWCDRVSAHELQRWRPSEPR